MCVAGRETEESMSGVFSSDDGTEHEALVLFEEEAETEENDSVPDSNYGQHEKNRPILRATRKMSKKIEAVAVMAEEIPRRVRFIALLDFIGVCYSSLQRETKNNQRLNMVVTGFGQLWTLIVIFPGPGKFLERGFST